MNIVSTLGTFSFGRRHVFSDKVVEGGGGGGGGVSLGHVRTGGIFLGSNGFA